MDQAKTLSGQDKAILPLCSTCKGEIMPPNLTIIDLKMETNNMASRGTCEACEERNVELRPRGDRQLCGKCRTIFSNTANWLPVVEMALAEIYPEKYGPGGAAFESATVAQVAVDEKVAGALKKIAATVKYDGEDPGELAVIVGLADLDRKRIGEAVEKTEAVLKRIAAAVGYEGDDPDELAGMVDGMSAGIERLEAQKEELKAMVNESPAELTTVLGLPLDTVWSLVEMAAIHTAALLDNAEIEIAAANMEAHMQSSTISDMNEELVRERQLNVLYLEELKSLRYDRECLVKYRDECQEEVETLRKQLDISTEPAHQNEALMGKFELLPTLPVVHLLSLATMFLANPNAGCEEVANWIQTVQREAA